MKNFSIGNNIRVLRERLGFSQENISKRAGITTNYFGRLERDQVNNVGFKTYQKIANALSVDVSLILFGKSFSEKGNKKINTPDMQLLPLNKEEIQIISNLRNITNKSKRNALLCIADSLVDGKK